jgi:uncharacterized Tic20 family protein
MSEVEVVEVQEQKAGKLPSETRKLGPDADAPKPRTRRAETKKLHPEPELALEVVTPAPHLGLTREEVTWAAMAHASILITLLLAVVSGGIAALLGPVIPAIIWYVYRDKSEYVVEQARQATIFQLAGIVALFALAFVGALVLTIGWIVSAMLAVVLVGLLLMPIMLLVTLVWVVAIVALPIVQVVYGCYAALETYNGRPFRYWWIAEMIDRYQAQG